MDSVKELLFAFCDSSVCFSVHTSFSDVSVLKATKENNIQRGTDAYCVLDLSLSLSLCMPATSHYRP